MKILLLILLMYGTSSAATNTQKKSIDEAIQSVKALVQPLLMGGKNGIKHRPGKFTVEKCEKHKVDWTAVLLRQSSAALTFTFKEGCDIEGTITPAVFTPFPIELKLKNLDEFNQLVTTSKITSSIESKPVLLLELTEGQLKGAKGVVKFQANYQVRVNPIEKARPIDENLGGELKISEIFGNRVQIKECIKVE